MTDSDPHTELIPLELNHKGSSVEYDEDNEKYFIVSRTVLTHYISFLVDADQAAEYVAKIVAEGGDSPHDHDTSATEICNQVWSNKKPTLRDHEATMLFMQLREKYSNKFDDRRTIAALNEKDYNVGTGKDATERCRQKFANLQKQYFAHVKHMKRTGEKKKHLPPYFSEIHGILGHKHKAESQNLQDSEESIEGTLEKNTDEEASSSSTSALLPKEDDKAKIKNRFAALKKSARPPSTNSQMLALIQQEHNEDRADRNLQFKSLENLMKQQNQQRERMLSLCEILVKKRKYSSSDEDN